MGKTKIKTIDDSVPAEEKKPSSAKATAGRPKDTLAASLLEQLNKEFGEVKSKEVGTRSTEVETKRKRPSVAKALEDKEEKKAEKVAPKAKEGQVKPRGKKYQEVAAKVDPNQKYPLPEAVNLVKETSYSKFPGTVEIHINTVVKNIRGLVSLPFATGKKLRILAFPSNSVRTSDLVKELEEMGVSIGSDETISEIEKGRINFDIMVTTPEWMPKLAKVARILGPRGLMPNPKNGTITDDLKKVVSELQAGKMEYKTESNGQVIHLGIGKVSQPAEQLAANVKTLYTLIGKSKIKKITLSPTMGPGVKVDLTSI